MTAGATYTIRVEGHLDDHWSRWLGGADLRRDEDGTTSLTVSDADQAQLHGLLGGLRDIGAVLVELRRVTTDGAAPVSAGAPRPARGAAGAPARSA